MTTSLSILLAIWLSIGKNLVHFGQHYHSKCYFPRKQRISIQSQQQVLILDKDSSFPRPALGEINNRHILRNTLTKLADSLLHLFCNYVKDWSS